MGSPGTFELLPSAAGSSLQDRHCPARKMPPRASGPALLISVWEGVVIAVTETRTRRIPVTAAQKTGGPEVGIYPAYLCDFDTWTVSS